MNSVPMRMAWAPAWYEKLSTTWPIRFSRAVGDPESVPKEATPAMLTAGPMGSDGGAFKSLFQNWARVSFTARGDRVKTLLSAKIWSVSARFAEAVDALSPPAPREFTLVTR